MRPAQAQGAAFEKEGVAQAGAEARGAGEEAGVAEAEAREEGRDAAAGERAGRRVLRGGRARGPEEGRELRLAMAALAQEGRGACWKRSGHDAAALEREVADPSPAERHGHGARGAGHVRRFGVCARSGGPHQSHFLEPPRDDQVPGAVVPGHAAADEEGCGVPVLLAAGEL